MPALSIQRWLPGPLIDGSLAMLYPAECTLCNQPIDSQRDLPCCAACWEADESTGCPRCWKCDFPLLAEPGPNGRRSCENCIGRSFAAARTAGIYAGALRAAILRLKQVPSVSGRLVGRLVETAARLPLTPDLITAPPLHPVRLRERGFNQAELLAGKLSKETGIRANFSILSKTMHTARHRAAQDRKDREESLRQSFEVRAPRAIRGRNVLIVDDLMTTGATADVLCRSLLSNGAATVSVVTAARATGFFHS